MTHLTKRELRDARRAERRAAEQTTAARALRRRRLAWLGGAAALAAAVVAGAIAVSSSGGAPAPAPASSALLDGIPERRGVLGDHAAPLTVIEFVDLQCPVCAQAAATTLPAVIDDYVRTGKAKLEVRTLHFLGPDSVRAARVAAGAERQGRLWPFLEAFFAAQGAENSGYVTDDFLREVAAAAGVDAEAALAYAETAAAEAPLARANADAGRLGVDATPTFAVARGDGPATVVPTGELLAELER